MTTVKPKVDAVFQLLSAAKYVIPVRVRYEFNYSPISQPLIYPHIVVGVGGATHTVEPDTVDVVAAATTAMRITVRVYVPQDLGGGMAYSLMDQLANLLLPMQGAVSFTVGALQHDTDAGAVVATATLELA